MPGVHCHILFRIPGQDGMFDFDEIREKHLPDGKVLEVTEKMRKDHSHSIGKMTVAAVLSKFG